MCVKQYPLISSIDICLLVYFLADFSNAVCSPPGTSKRSDSVGVIYWQVRPVIFRLLPFFLTPFRVPHRHQKRGRKPTCLILSGSQSLSNFFLFLDFLTQRLVRSAQGRCVVARRNGVGARKWQPAIRGRERYTRHRRRTAPARAGARGLFTIFSRFFAFMFPARRFATRSGRTARCTSFFPPYGRRQY